ncbi:hypothetical protein OLX02_00975 [Novosphingobium sp. KCTC 2891]|uniref:hypothetical protein n=1 Tax=Novosphingobium sp. KCTC 2891 TaxID=2989730 RepID=UPI002223648E|nr:hypothetical protein [Novosphingobium sp. KCTC 2891]MCW1381384.1 hypothetical protein [Novosphingobium sp. KCTC 2891]
MPESSLVQPSLPAAAPTVQSGLRKWGAYLGPAISAAILIAVLLELRKLNWSIVWSILPTDPVIWLIFVFSYFLSPFTDLVIFRRLWGIPWSGILPLLKKVVGNELLLGYIGEVYFYDWARRHVKMEGSPFGAVKDVAILSALSGNIMTLVMLALTWPMISKLGFGQSGNVLAMSLGIMLLTSVVIMYFRNGLLSLPRRELWFVFGMHCVRLVGKTALTALAWAMILPEVPLSAWLLLSTVRLLLSRLPLIPNKDIAFAGVAALLVGAQVKTGVMVAMLSMLTVAMHVVIFIILLLIDLVQKEKTA